ncbi:tripartite tricarboxylate transporter TctB family protein [Oceanomicrobium pacificus]|uniref:Tripartite tricarboxylate transporter TctB family protein n=1 Tax=Oceanomicrobium pacificus TaxID=2692916 RepID=A0A6B0U077_9RHOB|nr:tripartite tricarboxylate transporter TctB family protein [Oceanomicrobium pacificus]MXU66634.1 tripartite tricarboxylate transporter TctB family protein [Oceanomicrobium pacificus]
MASDRILGLVVIIVALAYVASAFQIQASFLSDPVGSRTFPILLGCVVILCGVSMILRPDPEPDWPAASRFIQLGIATLVMIGYAYSLKPLGFLLPTAAAAGILSYQIGQRAGPAILTGIGLSGGLFILFKYVLGLGLFAVPKGLFG